MKNKRINKGKSLISFPVSFTIIDIETTGLSSEYDQIIELSALKISDNTIVDKFSSLVKPIPNDAGIYVDDFITDLIGITNEMLSEAPDTIPTLEKYLNFLGNDVLIGHNVNFDINFIYDYSEKLFSKPLSNDFVDTLRISRRLHPNWSSRTLLVLSDAYGVDYTNAHRSLSDCHITLKCYDALRNDALSQYETLEAFFDSCKSKSTHKKLHPSDITATTDNIDTENPIYGNVFVFTGTLAKMSRREAMQIVVNRGGANADRVTQKTNYLVLGNNDYCSSIKDGKSAKQKKAESLKLKGHDIEIIPENVFYDMLEMQNGEYAYNKSEYILKVVEQISISDHSAIEKYTMNKILEMTVKNNEEQFEYTNDNFTADHVASLYNDATTDSENLRRLLGLPITKELRYMKKTTTGFIPFEIANYQIVKWYTDSNAASLEITLANGCVIRILGDYFSHMQKPSFEKDMDTDLLSS